jgi:hypothetical protein
MTIANEIRIHDTIGNATLIGPPGTAGFHIYDSSTNPLQTFQTYQEAIKNADPTSIIVWHEDLTPLTN